MSDTKKFSEENFDKNWQRKLVQLIMEDRYFADQIFEILEMDMFSYEGHRKYVDLIREYRVKYESYPSYDIMSTFISKELEESSRALQDAVRAVYVDLIAEKGHIQDRDYVQESALEFCRRQKAKQALMQAVDLVNTGSYSEMVKIMEDAISLGYSNELGHDFHEDFEKRYTDTFRRHIPTGHPVLDRLIEGGHGMGEIGIIVGGTGSGKSMALVSMGAHALLKNFNVIYYTLELSDVVVSKRFDSCLTNIPTSELQVYKDDVREKLSKIGGRLIVKEYPSQGASVQTIRNHLVKMNRFKFKPDLIIVDYLDLLKPTFRHSEKRHELGEMVEELRGLAKEFEAPLWTVTQANRTGYKADLVTMDTISESFSKTFAADLVVTLTRTLKEKEAGKATFHVAKNRNGPDGLIFGGTLTGSPVRVVIDGEKTFEQQRGDATKEFEETKRKLRKKYNLGEYKDS